MRPFILDDAGSMYANWINDPQVQGNYGEPVYGALEQVAELLERWIASYERADFYRWAIVLKDSGECIGQIAFCSVDTAHRYADLEYCIDAASQNQGYAAEALEAVIHYTFTHTGIHRLQAFHRGRNASSGRVLRKSSMKYEGTLRQSFYYADSGEYDDRIYYGITKGEYAGYLHR